MNQEEIGPAAGAHVKGMERPRSSGEPASPGTFTATESTPAPWLPEEHGTRHKSRHSAGLTIVGIVLAVMAILASLVLTAATGKETRVAPGPIVADHNAHRIDRVRADGSVPSVRFWFRAWGAPLVTEVRTDLPCARARLVQGGVKSQWFGTGREWSEPSAHIQIQPFLPAYLEVRIDPATHSLDGAVPLDHRVLVKTADGQLLGFDVDTVGNRPGAGAGDN